MSASELARRTLDHLRESKWIRNSLGSIRNGQHQHCVAGAALCVERFNEIKYPVSLDQYDKRETQFWSRMDYELMQQTFIDVAREFYDTEKPWLAIAIVNDEYVENFGELEQLMEKTIAKLEEKGA